MSLNLEIVEIVDRKGVKKFVDFQWQMYPPHSPWVPPLRKTIFDALDQEKNPFYKHAHLQAFMAYQGKRPVGRIAAIIDDRSNELHEENVVFFGFFECVDDQDICDALLEAVRHWGINRGADTLRGPASPSSNYEFGLLIKGFDLSPRIMMAYNHRYYMTLLEKAGLEKEKDLYAWDISADIGFTERIGRVAERQKKRHNISIRSLDKHHYDRDVRIMMEVYNSAWEKNWGFVPMDKAEFNHMAKDLKDVIVPELCMIAEVDREPIAFALALPNINQALIKIRSGRLTPLNLIKLLWYLKGPLHKKTITEGRILTLGVKREYQNLAIGSLLYMEFLKRGPALGLSLGEASWILEDNTEMNNSIKGMNGSITREYRIYRQMISATSS
jgi:ribosomal protein S18 acetylase RimI-like enzyme